ncbi:MAG: hypothetical protein A2452_12210 [Candidatus Firestonebacteria bacterium RIFOXYC2_FULL_39_67]|nr:MAG: hypothetical protein A2536_07740 [Candidatus Firestonebacteria bacterium RIFOXYD2_FULL_39_29]OGF55612.1 MAG: hypothetical protein A2452_12210 [Candidatus Firestonebacteria bacterium RIFOXYC2_FULL_39_67]
MDYRKTKEIILLVKGQNCGCIYIKTADEANSIVGEKKRANNSSFYDYHLAERIYKVYWFLLPNTTKKRVSI